MARFTNLPLAVRLAAAFGVQLIALALVTLLAFEAFGSFKAEVKGLAARDVRAVSISGQVGQQVQAIGLLAAEHVFDPASRGRAAAEVERDRTRVERGMAELRALAGSDPNVRAFVSQEQAWDEQLDAALASSSRELYLREIS